MNFDLPTFSAPAVAAIIGAKPSEIRDWRDRGLNRYVGSKLDHAVHYSVRDCAFLSIARDLIKLGFRVEAAAKAAANLLADIPKPSTAWRGTPADLMATIPAPKPNGVFDRAHFDVPGAIDTVIEIPTGAIFARIVARAAVAA